MPAIGDSAAIEALLRQRTEVLERMFSLLNLRLLNYGYRVHGDNYWVELDFEIAALDGGSLQVPDDRCGVMVKANLYDADGRMLSTQSEAIDLEGFAGYDTGSISFYTDGIALAADKARIFAVVW